MTAPCGLGCTCEHAAIPWARLVADRRIPPVVELSEAILECLADPKNYPIPEDRVMPFRVLIERLFPLFGEVGDGTDAVKAACALLVWESHLTIFEALRFKDGGVSLTVRGRQLMAARAARAARAAEAAVKEGS